MNREEIIELRDTGLSYAKIGAMFGVSRQRIHQIITEEKAKKAGIPTRTCLIKARNQRILERAKRGHKVQQITKEFGLSISYTYKILSKKRSHPIPPG